MRILALYEAVIEAQQQLLLVESHLTEIAIQRAQLVRLHGETSKKVQTFDHKNSNKAVL